MAVLRHNREHKFYLTREIEATGIKLTQADWLTVQKKQFLNRHLTALGEMIELQERGEENQRATKDIR